MNRYVHVGVAVGFGVGFAAHLHPHPSGSDGPIQPITPPKCLLLISMEDSA
jgi:hypothetical protein